MSVTPFSFSPDGKSSYLVENIYNIGKKTEKMAFHLKITSKKMKKF